MPKNPNSPYANHTSCGPAHAPVSASENIKLQVLATKLEAQLRDEFVKKDEFKLKTINLENILGDGNINITSISKIEKTSSEGLVDTYTIYFNDNTEPYSFTITNGEQGVPGQDGKDFKFEDFTPEQLESLRGPQGNPGKDGQNGQDGQDGKDFTYDMFTEEQLAALKGEKGDRGDRGEAFTYEMFTPEQLESLRGPKGETGEVGPQGPQGETGKALTFEDLTEEQKAELKGRDGIDGQDGYTPIKGVDYFDGEQGPKGDKGDKGDTGVQGEQGPKGDVGPQGEKGEKGDTGETGQSAYELWKSLGNDGTEEEFLASFKGEKGDSFKYTDFTAEQLEALRGPQGLQGEQGLTGSAGKDGIDGRGISSVDKKADFGPYSVYEIKFTDDTPAFEYTIYNGQDGKEGPKGDQGSVGPIGPKGEKGDQGEKGEAFKYEDFTAEQLESLRGPQGIQGLKGDKGDRGEKGETGPQGSQGIQGLQGPQGEKGLNGRGIENITKKGSYGQYDVYIINYTDDFSQEYYVYNGVDGLRGADGADGQSAYELWKELGNTGSKADFIASLKGERGTGINLKINAASCTKVGDAYIVKTEDDPNGSLGHVVIVTSVDPIVFEDGGYIKGEKGDKGDKGDKGAAFTYEDFTSAQLEALRGPQGIQGEVGPKGEQGEKGDAFTYADFTPEQLEALKVKGDTGEKGDKGDSFKYEDFTAEQLEALRGPKGEDGKDGENGYTPVKGVDYFDGKDGLNGKDGLTTAIKVGETVYEHVDGTISLPEFLTEHQSLEGYAKLTEIPSVEGLASETYVTEAIKNIEIPEAEIYKVDFNAPDYAKAVEAYNNGKVLILINAAPDINSYAVMNYVSEKYITFTKFLTSRSEAYGSFNTYYLSPANTWEVSQEVRLNKVEANPNEESVGELNKVRIGKEIFTIPQAPSLVGYATEEFVNKKIAEAELNDKDIDLEAYYTKSEVDALIPKVPTKVSELENDANYTNETKVLELIAANTAVADNKIGVDFTTDITVGRLTAGTEIKADMTIGEILRRILMCDHNWLDATCTAPKTCSLCGKTEGEALGHIEEVIEGKAATCEETGLTDGVRCSRCEKILVEQQVIPALGHNYASEVTLEPTCTTDGIRTYTCSNGCGETYTEVIPALGHNYVSEVIKPATCAEEGIRKYTCTRCGDTYEEVIPVLEHKQAIREENRVKPNCTTDGSYEKVTYCTECSEVLNRETIVLPALGHDYGDWVITKQPEVGVPGEQQKTCKRCGDVVTEVIPALPQPDEPVAFRYYTGPVSEENAFDYPDYWEEMGYDPQERAQHYFNNMTPVEINSWDDLVGQKIYRIANQLSNDPDTGYAGEETNTYSAIAINSNYEVVAWSTDEAGSYPATAIRAFEMDNGYTIYYAEDPIPASTTYDYYITIAKK